MDIDHKLDLIQELRREQDRRERNIYRNYEREYHNETEPGSSLFVSFRLRMLIAILLFCCFFLMERKEIFLGEIDHHKIAECISSDIYIYDLMNDILENTNSIWKK